MTKYILKRLLFGVVTIIGVFIVVFFVLRMIPGDPAVVMLGAKATDTQIEAFRAARGLDKPLIVQFAIALKNFFKFDFGMSLSKYKPVMELILDRLPKTAELSLLGIFFGAVFALIFGVVAAVCRGKWPDITLISLSTFGMSLPTFYIGLWVMMIFAVKLGWIPVIAGSSSHATHFQKLFGPLLTMTLGETALLLRTTRSSMLEILGEDFVRTARAKGLKERIVILKHALGNALIPIVTIVGYSLATAFGGAIVLESVFAREGIGKLLIDAINVRDYPLVQGATIIIAILMILVNILTDVVYGFVDPRIRVTKSVD